MKKDADAVVGEGSPTIESVELDLGVIVVESWYTNALLCPLLWSRDWMADAGDTDKDPIWGLLFAVTAPLIYCSSAALIKLSKEEIGGKVICAGCAALFVGDVDVLLGPVRAEEPTGLGEVVGSFGNIRVLVCPDITKCI